MKLAFLVANRETTHLGRPNLVLLMSIREMKHLTSKGLSEAGYQLGMDGRERNGW